MSSSKAPTIWKAPTIGDRLVLVISAGFVGRRIACTWVAAGYNVNIQEDRLKDRTEGLQYVVEHVADYSKRIGSTKRGIITASEHFDTTYAANAWLVIEALPEPVTENLDIFSELSVFVPEDCILCTSSMVYKSNLLLREVDRSCRNRIINLCHYLLPDIRVVELITNDNTDPTIPSFLSDLVSTTGVLLIIAKDKRNGFAFKPVWDTIKFEVLRTLDEGGDTLPWLIDKAWEGILNFSPKELGRLMVSLGKDYDEKVKEQYRLPQGLVMEPFAYLSGIYSKQRMLPPPSGSPQLVRYGTKVYFANTGLGINVGHPDSGCILCRTNDTNTPVNPLTIVTGLHIPYGLDIHHASKRIYWGDLADGDIKSCNIDGSDIKIAVPSVVDIRPNEVGTVKPKQLVIDQSSDKLYWTMSENLKIFRCNLDGSDLEIILETSTDEEDASKNAFRPIGLALDPVRGHFYWTQQQQHNSKKYRILRANMALPAGCTPSTRKDIEVVFADLPEVLSIDFISVFEEIYWSTRGGETMGTEVWRGFVDEEKKKSVVASGLDGANWIKVDPRAGHVYMSGLRGNICRFDMTTGDNAIELHSNKDGAFAGIAVIRD